MPQQSFLMVSASIRDVTHPTNRATAKRINSAPIPMRQEGGEQFPDDPVKKPNVEVCIIAEW